MSDQQLPLPEMIDYYLHHYPVAGDNLTADDVAEDAVSLAAEIKRLEAQLAARSDYQCAAEWRDKCRAVEAGKATEQPSCHVCGATATIQHEPYCSIVGLPEHRQIAELEAEVAHCHRELERVSDDILADIEVDGDKSRAEALAVCRAAKAAIKAMA